jgi:hypothetical protein
MSDRAQRPFWLHQLTEYVIGFALIVFGFQDPDPAVPAVAGIVVLVNAAIVRGPVGAFKLVGRKLHRVLDLLVMAALIGGAVQPWVDASALGRLVLIALVVPYAFLWWYTDWEERAGRKARRQAAAVSSGNKSEDRGRTAGRTAANAYLAGKRAIKKRSE